MRQDDLQSSEFCITSDAASPIYPIHTCTRHAGRTCNCAGNTCADDSVDTPAVHYQYTCAGATDAC